MKRNLAMTCALAAALVLAACAPAAASGQAAVSVSCDDFQKQAQITREVQVPAGSTFTVTLCSNPSTGFGWEEAKIADTAAVEQVSRESKAGQSSAPGSPGSEAWTLKALKKGTTQISFAYSRPWEGGEKGVWTLQLDVEVQ